MLDLSIVMPVYLKTEELLTLTKSAIYSFELAKLPKTELVIVDDNSPSYGGLLRLMADTCITHKENKGFMQSVNDGIRVARGKYLAVSNNDIRVAPNFYDEVSAIFEEHPDVLSVHPRMCFYDEPMLYGNNTYVTGRERWCQTSFFIIRKEPQFLFPEHLGGTGGAYDDWYFWSDVRRAGWKTAYTTKTCFQHKDSSTTQVVGEHSKSHKGNRELFKKEFGDYPEPYYEALYPDQMAMPWREEFTKL